MVEVIDDKNLLQHQSLLPDDLRQCCLMIVFAEPIKATLINDFLQIRLTDLMYRAGEESYYMANRWQPQHMGNKRCPGCREPMQQRSLNEFFCANRRCQVSAADGLVAGPRSGVIAVKYAPEHVIEFTGRCDMIDKCVIVLDRRYDERTLAAVLRTAHWIAEEHGWKIR